MEQVIGAYTWLMANYIQLASAISAIVIAGTAVVRLTPTKTDDEFLDRVSDLVGSVFDFLHIPNNLKNPPKQ